MERSTAEHDSVSASITNSAVDSDRSDDESGFGGDHVISGQTGATVIRFVSRFIDKVCSEGFVTSDHVRALNQMIPGVVVISILLHSIHFRLTRLFTHFNALS